MPLSLHDVGRRGEDVPEQGRSRIDPHENGTRGHRDLAEADPPATSGRTLLCPTEACAGHARESGVIRPGDWPTQPGLTQSLLSANKFCHQAIWHLAGTSLRHDKLGQGALANALKKLAEKL